MNELNELLNNPELLKYAPASLGAVFIVFAGYKILRHGISMILWILMMLVGAAGIGFSSTQDSLNDVQAFAEALGKAVQEEGIDQLPADLLKNVCERVQ